MYGIFQPLLQTSRFVSVHKKVHKILDVCNSREEWPAEMYPDKPVVQTIFCMTDKGETSGNEPQIQ